MQLGYSVLMHALLRASWFLADCKHLARSLGLLIWCPYQQRHWLPMLILMHILVADTDADFGLCLRACCSLI